MENQKGNLLSEKCRKLGISLSGNQISQFLAYYEHLIAVNQVMNLTAITEYEDVVEKHFADSLLLAQVIDLKQDRKILDLGTGAGFPGIPLKIAFPHLEMVLMDSLNKRIQFLKEVIEKLDLKEIEAVHARAEEAARKEAYREQSDLCVSRAVANLSSLSEYCLPFVKKDGYFISYKSSDIEEECLAARRAISLLGGCIEEIREVCLPDSEIRRSFVVIRKKQETPARYPRKAGMPSKKPL